MRKTHITMFLAMALLTLSACGQIQAEPLEAPSATLRHPEATATRQSTPTEAATPIQPCELLDQAEIQALGFTEYEIGEPHPGTGVPLGLGQAVNCQWEVGDPSAQFHHRLYLYVFQLGPDETPESAYQGQMGRMQNTLPVAGVGDEAVYSQTSQTMLVRQGDLLIYLRADVDDLTGEVDFQAGLEALAQLILERA